MSDVVMPQMGESIVEGTLTKWLKKPGDKVERDEPLFEISTDKVDTEIPSPASGVLTEVLVEEGATVSINTVVARIGDGGNGGGGGAQAGGDSSAGTVEPTTQPQAEETKPHPEPESPERERDLMTSQTEDKDPDEIAEVPAQQAQEPQESQEQRSEPSGPLSPLVRRMAREYNIDLTQVKGSGAGGRITKQDVEAYMAQQGAKTMGAPQEGARAVPTPLPTEGGVAPPPHAQPQPTAGQTQQQAQPAAQQQGGQPGAQQLPRTEPAKARVEPMSIMRSKIAEHMVMSKQTSAHVTTVHKVDMTKIAKIRDRQKDAVKERYGFSLTFLPFVASAAAGALRAFPIVNSSIEGNNIIYHNEVNIGIAVALENGLIVPVIRQADEKNIIGLQRSIADLAARARSRQLKPDEVQGGTFSITNFGSFGSLFATPVINQPQVGILGVGAVEKVPVVIEDAIAIRSMAYLALTFDHRLIDGALADQFCQKIKSVLENWSGTVL